MVPQLGISGRRSRAEEAQRGLRQHGGRADEGRLHDQRREGVGHDVLEDHPRRPGARGHRRLDVGDLAGDDDDAPHQPGDPGNLGYGERDDHGLDAGRKQGDEADRQQQSGDGHQAVHDPHEPGVDLADVAAQQPDHQPDEHRQQRDGDADGQGNAAAEYGAREDVPAEPVGPEPVLRRGRLEAAGDHVQFGRVLGRDPGREDGDENDHRHHEQAQRQVRIAADEPGDPPVRGRRLGGLELHFVDGGCRHGPSASPGDRRANSSNRPPD